MGFLYLLARLWRRSDAVSEYEVCADAKAAFGLRKVNHQREDGGYCMYCGRPLRASLLEPL